MRPRLGLRYFSLVLAAGIGAMTLLVPARRGLPSFTTLYEKDSLYHRVRVVERDAVRFLVLDRSFQGAMDLRDMVSSPYLYTDYAHLAWIFQPEIRRMLVIGLGAGTIPKRFARGYPHVQIDVVEVDPEVVNVARRFFMVQETGKLRIIVQDGRVFLRTSREMYDLIVMDAYVAEGIPFHLATREFMELARAHLRPGGLIAAHIIGALEGEESRLFRALHRTYGQVFPGVYLFPVDFRPAGQAALVRSIILMATSKTGMTRARLMRAGRELRGSRVARVVEVDALIADTYDRPIPIGDVPVLTDDYAPIDVLPIIGWQPASR